MERVLLRYYNELLLCVANVGGITTSVVFGGRSYILVPFVAALSEDHGAKSHINGASERFSSTGTFFAFNHWVAIDAMDIRRQTLITINRPLTPLVG